MNECPHYRLVAEPGLSHWTAVCEFCGQVVAVEEPLDDPDDLAERDRADAANDLRRDK